MLEATTLFTTDCQPKDEETKISLSSPPQDYIGGIVYEQGTKITLDSATAIVYDKNNKIITTISSDEAGHFSMAGLTNVSRLVFFRHGYFSVTKILASETNKKVIVVEMPKLELDKIIKLEGILYDLGKFNIRPDAARVLDNVVEVMKENTTLEIELSAHTDSRGSDQMNMTLSDNRAKAAAAYIVSKGIDASRIVGKGYGESKLKNECANAIKCTETKHQENRRTEAKIIKY